MLNLLLRVSALTLGLYYVSATANCQALQQSQLASLNERMNQMINTLYSSPVLSSISKSKSSSPPSYQSPSSYPSPSPYPAPPDYPPPPYDPNYYQSYQQSSNAPVVYMSSSSGTPPSVTIQTTTQPCPYHSSEPEPYPKSYPSAYYDYYYNQNQGCKSAPSYPGYQTPPSPPAPAPPTASITRTYEYNYPPKPYEYQYPEAPSPYYPPTPCSQTPPTYPPSPPSYPTPPAYPSYGPQGASPYGTYQPRTEFVNSPAPYPY